MLLLPQFDSLVFFDRSGSDGWQKTESVTIVPRTFLFSDQVNDGAFRDFSLHAEFRKNLISKRVNLDTSIYLLRSDNQYPTKPDFHQKTSYQLDLTHGIRFHGAWPTLGGDFTGDGHRDLLIARDEKIAIYPKNQNGDLFSKPLTQFEVFTSPFMNIVDLNGDGRDDLIFYEKRRDGKISILLNAVEWKDMPALEKKSMPFDKK
jgi:hypothetical protein